MYRKLLCNSYNLETNHKYLAICVQLRRSYLFVHLFSSVNKTTFTLTLLADPFCRVSKIWVPLQSTLQDQNFPIFGTPLRAPTAGQQFTLRSGQIDRQTLPHPCCWNSGLSSYVHLLMIYFHCRLVLPGKASSFH